MIKQRCYVCMRFVTRTRKGNGAFRKHNIDKGQVCEGSWKYPDETKEIGRAMRTDPAKLGSELTMVTEIKDGEVVREIAILPS